MNNMMFLLLCSNGNVEFLDVKMETVAMLQCFCSEKRLTLKSPDTVSGCYLRLYQCDCAK